MAPIKILAVMEAGTVTGPAQSLFQFFHSARADVGGTNGAIGEISDAAPEDERVAISLATFHRRARNERPSSENVNEFVAAARATGIPTDVIIERFRFDAGVLAGLRQVVARRAPDVIETHHVKSHFLLRLSGLWRHRPWVAFHHGYTTTDAKMRAYNRLDRWSLRKAGRIVTVSRAFARDLAGEGLPPDRIRALHNAIPADWGHLEGGEDARDEAARALREHLKIAPDERVVLAVGRLSQEKAHTDLVAALAHLRRLHPTLNARLVIAGAGPEREAIGRAAAEAGVGSQVVFAGQVSDIVPFYALADVLALPSLSEGSPLTLLEAMAVGVPIVATRVGGVPEMVTDKESALLVAPRDVGALAAALGLVLTDARLADELAANARTALIRHHTPAAHHRARIAIYRELLPARSASQIQCRNIAGANEK